MTRRRPTVLRRIAKLIAATSLLSLLVFSAVAYVAIYLEDKADIDLIPEADDDATEFFLLAFGVAAPISLVLTLTGALWLARRSLRPIDEVIRSAREMSMERLGRRLPLPSEEDELHEMVTTLNGLFERLEAGFDGLRSFSADVSHELRTPLAIVITELEVASRKPRSHEEWSEATGGALATLRRMVQLVEGLLELARGGLDGPRNPVDLVAVTDEVVAAFSARAEARRIRLDQTSAESALTAGNRAALATAVSALVENAIRYTPLGGRVHVTVERIDSRVLLHVDDDGPGIAVPEQSEIFEPLRRGKAGSADGTGFGLGLAIVKRVVDQHQGAVDVADSELGGARFTVALPIFIQS